MSGAGTGEDQVRVSIAVDVPQDVAFRVFTEQIDQWWRRGVAYRVAGERRGFVHLEPGVGGRLYEAFEADDGERLVQTGAVTAWEPPARLAFDWRSTTFGPGEVTRVEVTFEPRSSGTFVTVVHSGWRAIRGDHPVRHGEAAGAFLRRLGLWWGGLLRSLRSHAG